MITIVRHLILSQKFILLITGSTIFYFSSVAIGAERNSERTTISAGSLALSELNGVLNQSTKLKREVKEALQTIKKDDVGCIAPIIRRPSIDIHNSRIAPFSCFFANKVLTIQARNSAHLPNGKMIPLEQLLKRQTIPHGISIQFKLTGWKWTTPKR